MYFEKQVVFFSKYIFYSPTFVLEEDKVLLKIKSLLCSSRQLPGTRCPTGQLNACCSIILRHCASEPGPILWSDTRQKIVMFTLPREDKEDCKRKMLRWTELQAKVGECGRTRRRRLAMWKTAEELERSETAAVITTDY